LNENDCRNRGYVIDGYPRNFKDCQNILLKKDKKIDPETGEEIEEEEPELEEGEEKSFDKYIVDQTIFPSSCIVLQQEDEFLIKRVKNLPEVSVQNTHYNE
jgi:hypothetical protein